jgi:cholesterol transport system auxiliary component
VRLAAAAAGSLLLALGCSLSQPVPQPERFVLRAERTGAALPGGGGVLELERVRVAAPFERQRFMYRSAEASFQSDFYRQFQSPPGVLVREATRDWLAASGLFDAVLDRGGPPAPDWLLQGEVHALYADLRQGVAPTAVLEVEFRLLDARSAAREVRFRRRYAESAGAASPRAEALVAAWNECLARLLGALEGDLRGVVRR